MDWNAAIERNGEALKRILAMLVAMAGLAGGAALTSPLWGSEGRARQAARPESEASGGGGDLASTPTRQSDDCRPPLKGEVNSGGPTLPRHLHRAVLRLLRPAEAAARRLVIVAARDLVVELPPARPHKSKPKPTILRNGIGTGIVMPRNLPHPEVRGKAEPRRTLCLPLTDTLPQWRRSRTSASGVPRISFPGFRAPSPIPVRRPLLPDDPIDASRLGLRLQALASALDDLPRHARRFARWRARNAASAQNKEHRYAAGKPRTIGRHRRLWPLRPGRPPGQHRPGSRRPAHDVDQVLGDLQHFAFCALERPDTS